MPIAITDTQRALADAIRDWAARARPIEAVRAAEQATAGLAPGPSGPAAGWRDLADIGVFGIAAAEDLGGAGGTVADAAVAVEQAAAALAPGPVLPTVLAALLLGRTPSAAVAKELGPALIDGRAHAAVALDAVVPAAAEGASRRRLAAVAQADGSLRVTGDAGLVLAADEAAHLLLAARVDDQPRWLLVAPDAAGLHRTPVQPLDFSRPLARVRLDDVVVPPAAVLGVAAAEVRDLVAVLAAAEAAGVAGWCLRTAAEYAGVREQFGRRIGEFQAVKHLCAGMLLRAEQATALAWDAARAADEDPEQLAIAAAVAMAAALDAAVDNAKDCVQVLGGIGFTWEHDAHLYLRRAVALRQLLGGSRRWQRRAAELTLAGSRRQMRALTDESAAPKREQVSAEVAAVAALPSAERRRRLVENGYLLPHWPKPYGLDASPAEQLLIDAELADAGVQRPRMLIDSWAAATLLAHGTPEQQERYLLPTLYGELTWCQLFSEPEAGSDLAALHTKAIRTDGGWLLTGQKVWTSLAQFADRAICLARTDPDAAKHHGITYFLVDMRAAGIETRPLREITGEERFNEVFLSEVFVPDADVVGEVNGGWPLARTTLANERVAMSGGSALGDDLERLLSWLQQHDAVEEVGLAELGRLIAQGAACSVLDVRGVLNQLAGRAGPESAGARGLGAAGGNDAVRKLVGVQHRQAVAEVAVDVLGPAAAADDAESHDALYEFLLSRCLSIAGGTTQVLLNVAAERLLGLPRGK